MLAYYGWTDFHYGNYRMMANLGRATYNQVVLESWLTLGGATYTPEVIELCLILGGVSYTLEIIE